MFVGIEDDGGDSDWVAGVTLSAQAKVRIVAADDSELPECSQAVRECVQQRPNSDTWRQVCSTIAAGVVGALQPPPRFWLAF